MASLPQHRDVIVHKSSDKDLNPYGVGPYGGIIQFLCASCHDALDHADRVAMNQRVDLWYTEDGQQYHCMAKHRTA